ncbi:Vascular endothelial growth factor A [Liparis tanakae]|uniref:Vascular endothelial growth factor A n=1 Tax=Liparis tanakae TaxID=230148 RepID=A0A4Z2HGI2_9TELE|nr:Vascular endothelial growth factor A [Liparis tanakae]
MAEDIHSRRSPPPAEGNPILPRWTLGLEHLRGSQRQEEAAVPLTSVCSDWEREPEGGNPRTVGSVGQAGQRATQTEPRPPRRARAVIETFSSSHERSYNASRFTMQSFIGLSHLFSVLLLQPAPAQISHPPEDGHSRGKGLAATEQAFTTSFTDYLKTSSRLVMAFHEVMARSMCRPMEQLVDVEQEYPGEVEYIYMPACVPLWRCSGCCGDENLECQASLERNVTLQVMRIHPMISMHHVELPFVEHQRCECRPRQKQMDIKSSSGSESIKNRPRRRKHKKTANGCGKCQLPQKKINLH